jgi:hypothetical protein
MDDTTVDGIRIKVSGERRGAYDIARDFIREQSQGEWGDDQIEADADKLAKLLIGFARVFHKDYSPSPSASAPLSSEGI